MNEILAVVKFNNYHAFVLKDKVNFKYKQYDNLLIGIDETQTFVDVLYYERPFGRFKAFGGREFDLPLEDGGTIHCSGQWWSGGSSSAEKILNKKLIGATYHDIESLKSCYVYTGTCAFKDKIDELISSYNGKIYGYREYEEKLKTDR